jgi:hypothetical protein
MSAQVVQLRSTRSRTGPMAAGYTLSPAQNFTPAENLRRSDAPGLRSGCSYESRR